MEENTLAQNTKLGKKRKKLKCKLLFYSLILCLRALRSCFSHVQLFVTPMDCSPPGSSVHGIRQARILQWVPIPSFSRSSHPRIKPTVSFISCIACRLFTTEPLGNFFELLFYSEPLASWFVKRKQNSEGFMM